MTKKINILVTGCGGDIGQSVGKILNELTYVNNLYGSDISEKNAAKFIFPNFFLGLPYTDFNYLKNLENIASKLNIDLIIPVSEPELRFFSRENILNNIGNARLLTASSKSLKVGFDKLGTADFLRDNNLPHPITHDISLINKIENYPVVLKSRTGSGSSKVYIVDNDQSFYSLKKNNSDFLVQEYLEGDSGEFTCGLFRSTNGVTRTIILKRELMGGFSGYGEVVEDAEIDDFLVKLAEKLELVGSINVQLRITSKGPMVFEINPRFSSTVRFRDLLGFQDVKWSIEDRLGFPISDYTNDSIGKKFYKGFNEYIL